MRRLLYIWAKQFIICGANNCSDVILLIFFVSILQKDPSPCSDSALSETMPDIAMATSAMNQLSLNDLDLPQPDLELDLGDGSRNHSNPGTLYIWWNSLNEYMQQRMSTSNAFSWDVFWIYIF